MNEKEFVEMAVGVVTELNKFDKYCNTMRCSECPLNLNIGDCDLVDSLKSNLIKGIELVVQKLKK